MVREPYGRMGGKEPRGCRMREDAIVKVYLLVVFEATVLAGADFTWGL